MIVCTLLLFSLMAILLQFKNMVSTLRRTLMFKGLRCIVSAFCLVLISGLSVSGYPLLSMPDVANFASYWLNTDLPPECPWDINNDGKINLSDFAFFAQDSNTALSDMDLASGQFQQESPDGLATSPVYITRFSMSKFCVTNQQYVEFLDWAVTYHQATVKTDGVVYGACGTNSSTLSVPYCDTHDSNSLSQIDYLLTAGGNPVSGAGSGADMIINAFAVRIKAGRSMANDPMVMVSWYGAVAYCNWLSGQRGIQPCYSITDSNAACNFLYGSYRLPTEAEWQYAAHGGRLGRFPFGDDISHSLANYFSEPKVFPYDLGPEWGYNPAFDDGIFPYTAPVWSFKPNGFGLYQMAGNVSQWCNDWFCPMCATPLIGASNPTGPASGVLRVIHGGGWDNTADRCQIFYRGSGSPACRYGDVGFRVVWNPFMVALPPVQK
jgi:formylglycine-generating enzyme required for sulfatase activity